MELLEFAYKFQEMCDSYGNSCDGCKVNKRLCKAYGENCLSWYRYHPYTAEKIVKEWIKEKGETEMNNCESKGEINYDEAKEFLIKISYDLGNMGVEHLTESDGEKMRDAISIIEKGPQDDDDDEDGNLVKYAKTEMKNWIESNDEMSKMMANDILELVKVFSKQDHSGFSAGIAIPTLSRILSFKPLSPLTGEDDEWNEVGHDEYQNKRYSAVFKKGKDGRAYNIEGKIFSDDGGETWYGSKASHVFIDFPYTVPDEPEKIYVNKEEELINAPEEPEDKEEKMKALKSTYESLAEKKFSIFKDLERIDKMIEDIEEFILSGDLDDIEGEDILDSFKAMYYDKSHQIKAIEESLSDAVKEIEKLKEES